MAEYAEFTYPTVRSYWKDGPVLRVLLPTGTLLARFPIEFLQEGRVLTWDYISSVCQDIVDFQRAQICADAQGSRLVQISEPAPGTYFYVGEGEPQWTPGPQSKRTGRPSAPASGSVSTMSDSARSSGHQVYREILDPDDPHPYLFQPSMGLLLEDAFHRAYDQYDFSFHVTPEGNYVVHYFVSEDPQSKQYHGKLLTSERFRVTPEWRPDPRLLKWHYRQCVQAHLRGFSVANS